MRWGEGTYGAVDAERLVDVRCDEVVVASLCARSELRWRLCWFGRETLHCCDVFFLFFGV